MLSSSIQYNFRENAIETLPPLYTLYLLKQSTSKQVKKENMQNIFGHPPIFVQAMNSTENELIISYRSILTTQCLHKGKEREMRGITWHPQDPSWSSSPSSLLLPMDDLEMSTFVCFRLFPVQKLRQFRTF